MRSKQEQIKIARALQRLDMPALDDPALVAHLALLVRDHYHLQCLVAKCEPQHRAEMYNALKPNLRFEAHSLDWYLARAKQDAEARQLPAWDDEKKTLSPFKTPEVKTIESIVERALLPGRLLLTCRKCTKAQEFYAASERKADAIAKAREIGWGYDPVGHFEICPDCMNLYGEKEPNHGTAPLCVPQGSPGAKNLPGSDQA